MTLDKSFSLPEVSASGIMAYLYIKPLYPPLFPCGPQAGSLEAGYSATASLTCLGLDRLSAGSPGFSSVILRDMTSDNLPNTLSMDPVGQPCLFAPWPSEGRDCVCFAKFHSLLLHGWGKNLCADAQNKQPLLTRKRGRHHHAISTCIEKDRLSQRLCTPRLPLPLRLVQVSPL